MKRAVFVALALSFAALSVLVRLSPVGAQESRPAVSADSLAFLAGEWISEEDTGERFRAHYTDPEGGVVLGVSKAIRGGKTLFFELEVFQVREGELVLDPYPGAKRAASFKAKEVGKDFVRFENPKNDFPTAIRYARTSADRLEITLSGGGKEQRFQLERKP